MSALNLVFLVPFFVIGTVLTALLWGFGVRRLLGLRLPDSVAPPLPPDFACKRNLEVGVDRGFAENRGAARSRRSLRRQGCKRTPYPALAHRDCAEHNVL